MKDGLIIDNKRNKYWYQNYQLHRVDGPAIEYPNGDKEWYQNGLLHREDGPAVEYADGDKIWYQNNKRHRLDGPAIERADGDKAWYISGQLIDCSTQEKFERILKLKAFM